MKVQFQLIGNYNLFWTFSDMWIVLILKDISYFHIEKIILIVGYFLATFCSLINISRKLNIVYVWSLLVLSFMQSFVLTILYIVSFTLIFELYKSSLQILHLISDHPLFLKRVNTEGYFVGVFGLFGL